MWKNENSSILIVGGSTSKLSQAKKICEDAKVVCYTTRSTFEAMDILFSHQVDSVLALTGFGHVIELIRTFSTVPCTYINCSDCMQPGGADYVVEIDDFKIEDILKHHKIMLDEAAEKTHFSGSVWFKKLHIDMDNYMVVFDNTSIKMKPLEIKLLFYLLKHLNRLVSRKRLLSNVWHYEQGGETRTLDVHIMALRAIIEKNEIPLGIETQRGEGYKLYDKEIAGGRYYFSQI